MRAARGAPELVSVVVCVLNAEPWLGDQLEALAAQTYAGRWEALVVDNGCTDRSMEIARGFTDRLPELRIVAARGRRSLNHARNAGADAARGKLLAFCDADDVVLPGWLDALVSAAPEADIVGGTFDIETLNPPLYQAWRPDEPMTELPVDHGFLPYVNGGNCAVWTSVARELRWDEAFDHGSSETEFCWRAQLASHTLAFVPGAVIKLRYRRSIRALARQYYSYGRSAPPLYRRFRHLGMPRDNGQAVWWWRWLANHVRHLTESRERRGNWIRIAAFRCGRIGGSLRARTLFL
jgi:glycosyltransferase involved in cell wall biosynthesis